MSGKLLPCPFCGAPAKLTRFERGDGVPAIWVTQILCDNDKQCMVCVDIQHINEAVAIKGWNTRSVTVGLPDPQKTL